VRGVNVSRVMERLEMSCAGDFGESREDGMRRAIDGRWRLSRVQKPAFSEKRSWQAETEQ
jgi:hypothetical protein